MHDLVARVMKLCDWSMACPNWAQWRATYPDKKTVRVFCNTHKEELNRDQAEIEESVKIKFAFVGSVPEK